MKNFAFINRFALVTALCLLSTPVVASEPIQIGSKRFTENHVLATLAGLIFVRKDWAEMHHVATISEFAEWLRNNKPPAPFLAPISYYNRPDGLRHLMATYGMVLPEGALKLIHSFSLVYRLVADGEALAAVGFNTNAEFKKYNLRKLRDDLSFFPIYNPAPLVRIEIIEKYPTVRDLLDKLSLQLTEKAMVDLNYAIDIEGRPLELVCQRWLYERGFINR